jgi:hypothetical protein
VLDPIMEKGLAYLAAQGIAGINVDFMDRDDQQMVRWYEKLLDSAARHKLMVELHGAFVPRGLARTYPNFITQEGVLGSEYNKWSRRVTATHNVMLAYTRAMLGPMDYIPGGFVNVSPAEFEPRWVLPMVQTTRAHNLSMFVVFESPWTSLQDSPDTYRANPAGFDFIREVPTSWDETRFIAGEVGQYIAIGKRKGDLWYIGAMNGDSARKVSLPLSFLGGGSWTAELWLDGDRPDAIRRDSRRVTAADRLEIDLAGTGGAVAVLRRQQAKLAFYGTVWYRIVLENGIERSRAGRENQRDSRRGAGPDRCRRSRGGPVGPHQCNSGQDHRGFQSDGIPAALGPEETLPRDKAVRAGPVLRSALQVAGRSHGQRRQIGDFLASYREQGFGRTPHRAHRNREGPRGSVKLCRRLPGTHLNLFHLLTSSAATPIE